MENKTSEHVASQFEHVWLHRYPRPVYCIYDAGGEFTGYAFQQLLRRWAIHPRPTSVKNPQSNAVCERMHQTVANIIRTLTLSNPPRNIQQARAAVVHALSVAQHAVRTTAHSTLKHSPGSIIFNRDMFMDIPFVADLILLRNKRQQLIDYNVRRENNRRRNFDYQVGQRAWRKVYNPTTLQERKTGPYRILQVHTNGTVTLQVNEHTTERVNIRRLEPQVAP